MAGRLPRALLACQTLAASAHLCDIHAVDASAHYRQLVQLGRDEFLAAAAPAALVRHRSEFDEKQVSGLHTMTIDQEIEGTLPGVRESFILETDFELYPLTKKPGASFPDRITVGRTPNNDIVIPETSISRFHAYVRRDGNLWVVADAGSKNGSWLEGQSLAARKERPLPSHATVRLGDVDLMFYIAEDLYIALGGT